MNFRKNINESIEVSVFLICFNHGKYIKDCIESILSQKTKFNFEVLIHDDASSDQSQEIIESYNKKDDRIKVILQSENQYSKGIKPFETLKSICKGKYIAWCEGDDKWNDPDKLQKQYDFMESNLDYSICYHSAVVINESGKVIRDSKVKEELKRDFSSKDLMKGKFSIPTQTSFFLSQFDIPRNYYQVINEDIYIFSTLGKLGKGKFLEDIKPACYRVHDGGVWSAVDKKPRMLSLANTYRRISENYLSNKDYYYSLYYFVRSLKAKYYHSKF